jgi:hypothetical protein
MVEEQANQETNAKQVSCLAYSSALKMEATRSSGFLLGLASTLKMEAMFVRNVG